MKEEMINGKHANMFKPFVGCEFDEYCQDCVDVMEKYEAAILTKREGKSEN